MSEGKNKNQLFSPYKNRHIIIIGNKSEIFANLYQPLAYNWELLNYMTILVNPRIFFKQS